MTMALPQTVSVVRDSMSPGHLRLTTLVIMCPAYYLLELLPIRELSVTRRGTPRHFFAPLPRSFGKDMNPLVEEAAVKHWRGARSDVTDAANSLANLGASNAVLERMMFPYRGCEIVATSASWPTVITQLQALDLPEMALLAESIGTALTKSQPTKLSPADWHLPFIDDADIDAAMWHVVNDNGLNVLLTDLAETFCLYLLAKVSISRVVNGPATDENRVERIKNDLRMFSLSEGPFATSRRDAYDHQATPDTLSDAGWRNAHLHGNLTGWCQYRQVAQWEAWKRR